MSSQEQPPPYPGFQQFVGQQPYPPQQQPFPPQQQQPYGVPVGANYPQQAGFVPTPGNFQNTPYGYGPPPVHPMMFPVSGSGDHTPIQDDEAKDLTDDWRGFSNKAIRALFIRKVYLILMLQLTFTLGVICLFVFEKHVKLFVQQNMFIYMIAYVVFLGVYIALVCCGNLRRQYPGNVIMLSIFTVCMSYLLGTISSFHDTQIVLMAVGICAAICLIVTIFSFYTKFDFTTCGGVLFVLCWVLFLFGIIAIFTRDHILDTVYAGCGALLFVAFLAYDTQMITGGKKHEMSAEEHIFAAICLYLDVVYIFMFLLMALGGGKK